LVDVVAWERRRRSCSAPKARFVVISSCQGGLGADITKAPDHEWLLDALPKRYGLVTFAGTPARARRRRHAHEGNYEGPILLAHAAADRMKATGTESAIVLFAISQAIALFPGSTALLPAARILAKECRGAPNIRVNVIAERDGGRVGGSQQRFRKVWRYRTDGVIPRYGKAADVVRGAIPSRTR
jgi:hypothetical protein